MRYWADFKRGGSDYSSHFTTTAKHKRNTMSRTYKAVQATQPGKLEVVERAMIDPAFGQVRIRVDACGVCHSDALTVEGGFPGLTYPRVPGHEVIGKIEAIGPGVQGWKEGQRVGVGFMGGHCGHCESCRRGDFVNCQNQPISGWVELEDLEIPRRLLGVDLQGRRVSGFVLEVPFREHTSVAQTANVLSLHQPVKYGVEEPQFWVKLLLRCFQISKGGASSA